MNIQSIVQKYLLENDYDGLYNYDSSWDGCSCELDDLFPCDSCAVRECYPGYKRPIDPSIDFDVDPEVMWVMGPVRK